MCGRGGGASASGRSAAAALIEFFFLLLLLLHFPFVFVVVLLAQSGKQSRVDSQSEPTAEPSQQRARVSSGGVESASCTQAELRGWRR